MQLLNAGLHDIEHLTDRFPEDAKDEEWMPVIALERDLILLSADPAITSGKKEKEIWRASGLTSFFFGGGFADKGKWQQVQEVVRWWPEIVREAKEAPHGSGYLLPMGGSKPKKLYIPAG